MEDDAWPEHLLATNHPVREWRSRSEETWEAIRQAYLTGVPARELCDRYEVALSTLRLRAREGGWRRADQPDSDLFPADADLWVRDEAPVAAIDIGEETWDDLAERVRFRLRRAIVSGRAAEAASWLRVFDRLRGLAAADIAPPYERPDEGLDVEPAPDPVAAYTKVASRIGAIARRAARVTDDADIEALEAEIEALTARATALPVPPATPVLDSLDSLDPVFSGPVEAACAGSDLSSRSHPPPETPALPPSSPAPAPDCGAESGRSGR